MNTWEHFKTITKSRVIRWKYQARLNEEWKRFRVFCNGVDAFSSDSIRVEFFLTELVLVSKVNKRFRMQEFRVLRCVECEAYQVDIIKKAKKWTCKVCSMKQSVKYVYFTSNAGEIVWQFIKTSWLTIEVFSKRMSTACWRIKDKLLPIEGGRGRCFIGTSRGRGWGWASSRTSRTRRQV